jgi:AcrR family transcriptional regulator
MFTDMATRKRPRPYQKKRRAAREAETRQRIVEAMVELHGEVGPLRTTISAIAERAGVERLTVYRHFPDERSMFEACTSHYATQVPGPDSATWAGIDEPAERLRKSLLAFYDYYGRAEDVLTHAARDVPQLPALAAVLSPWEEFVGRVREDLLERWGVQEPARARLAGAVAHALRFETWKSLARAEELGDAEAAELMVALAEAAAGLSAHEGATQEPRAARLS